MNKLMDKEKHAEKQALEEQERNTLARFGVNLRSIGT